MTCDKVQSLSLNINPHPLKYTVSKDITAREALQQLNSYAIPNMALFVVDASGKAVGTVSDGDIRRGLLNELSIQDKIDRFMNTSFRYFPENEDNNERLKQAKASNIRFVPVLDRGFQIKDIIDLEVTRSMLPLEAVLMAGGVGERLRPLTEKLPKPLLKVGDMSIIERNIERLSTYGISRFHITTRYLAELLEAHIGDGKNYRVKIDYIREEAPLGTIGALRTIPEFEKDYLIVMNSDLLTNIDFTDFFSFFISSGADMAVATVPYHVDVPYAVLKMDDEHSIVSFHEKPRYTYYSNAGIYLMKKEMVNLIPPGKKFDATDLMETLISKGYKVKSFPIVGYWLDIGRMEDYRKAQEDVKHIRF